MQVARVHRKLFVRVRFASCRFAQKISLVSRYSRFRFRLHQNSRYERGAWCFAKRKKLRSSAAPCASTIYYTRSPFAKSRFSAKLAENLPFRFPLSFIRRKSRGTIEFPAILRNSATKWVIFSSRLASRLCLSFV